MIYYMAYAVEKSRMVAGRWVDGETMLQSDGGVDFEGFNQPISSDEDGLGMLARYVVLDSDGGDKLYMTHTLEAPHTLGKFGAVKYNGRSIHFAGSSPSTDSRCWFSPYITCSWGRWSSIGVSDVPVAYGKMRFVFPQTLSLYHSLYPPLCLKEWTQVLSSFCSSCSVGWLEVELPFM